MTDRPGPGTVGAAGRGTLLLAGNTLHVQGPDGRYCTHRALARQLDEWFSRFDRVVIAAVLDPGPEVPTGFAAYARSDITFVPLAKAGGVGWAAKFGALAAAWSWVRALVPLLRRADVVHLRAPCNITIPAIPLARVLTPRRYAIYAGAWDAPAGGSRSYTLQRWMLRRFGGVVHVYAPPSQGLAANLRTNFSPSFSDAQLDSLGVPTEQRLDRIRAKTPGTGAALRVSCVGRFSANKNQAALVESAAVLVDRGVSVEVRFAGSGGTEADVRALARRLGVEAHVSFLGRLDESELVDLWAWADVNATLTRVEGYGRVTLEAMAVGCPTLCGPGAMQAELVGQGERGIQVLDPAGATVAAALETLLVLEPERWVEMSVACREYARAHTIEAFGAEVDAVLSDLGCDPADSRPGR